MRRPGMFRNRSDQTCALKMLFISRLRRRLCDLLARAVSECVCRKESQEV